MAIISTARDGLRSAFSFAKRRGGRQTRDQPFRPVQFCTLRQALRVKHRHLRRAEKHVPAVATRARGGSRTARQPRFASETLHHRIDSRREPTRTSNNLAGPVAFAASAGARPSPAPAGEGTRAHGKPRRKRRECKRYSSVTLRASSRASSRAIASSRAHCCERERKQTRLNRQTGERVARGVEPHSGQCGCGTWLPSRTSAAEM
jgi:hypothetical protein